MDKPCPRCGRMCHSFASLRSHAVACDKKHPDTPAIAQQGITGHEDAPTVNQVGWLLICLKRLHPVPEALAGLEEFLQQLFDSPPDYTLEENPLPKSQVGILMGMVTEAAKAEKQAPAKREPVEEKPKWTGEIPLSGPVKDATDALQALRDALGTS